MHGCLNFFSLFVLSLLKTYNKHQKCWEGCYFLPLVPFVLSRPPVNSIYYLITINLSFRAKKLLFCPFFHILPSRRLGTSHLAIVFEKYFTGCIVRNYIVINAMSNLQLIRRFTCELFNQAEYKTRAICHGGLESS